MSTLSESPTAFRKADHGKPRTDLLPPRAMLLLADVLGFGAQKYGGDNWRAGGPLARPRYIAAALRHIFALMAGEWVDEESGLPHLGHAMACLAFAFELAPEG